MVGTAKNKDFDRCQISTNIVARVRKEGKGNGSVVVRLQIRVHLVLIGHDLTWHVSNVHSNVVERLRVDIDNNRDRRW